jgi:hypothetical protein
MGFESAQIDAVGPERHVKSPKRGEDRFRISDWMLCVSRLRVGDQPHQPGRLAQLGPEQPGTDSHGGPVTILSLGH